tara:strand:+ start:565 stop:1383 length:819 start_codon:yes stop_codon:yes gene_type:complete
MQCILSALRSESQPFIHYFHLERETSFNFPVYRNNDLYLLGIGIGKKLIKKRVSTFFKNMNKPSVQFINIGLAGGKKGIHEIGDIFLINKIKDEASQKLLYPDILIKHPFQESGITTVDKSIGDGGAKYQDLVDMEASEIFKICSQLSSINNIAFIKIVSDHMDIAFNNFNNEFILNLIEAKLVPIGNFIKSFKINEDLNKNILNNVDLEWLKQTIKILRLTKTQEIYLEKYLKGYRIRKSGNIYPILPSKRPESKINRNKIFQNICEELIS